MIELKAHLTVGDYMSTKYMQDCLAPIRDSLPKRTWRNESSFEIAIDRVLHQYPTKGCHGDPLENDYPNRRNLP